MLPNTLPSLVLSVPIVPARGYYLATVQQAGHREIYWSEHA